jgi:hypothetical protein
MEIDTSRWSGDGDLTVRLIEVLKTVELVQSIRVDDAPSSRTDLDYNFLANELFVSFCVRPKTEWARLFGVIPFKRRSVEKAMTIPVLEHALASHPDIGPADYSDEGMIQYLRTERIVAPYQTRGYKLVELVRIYEAGTAPRA